MNLKMKKNEKKMMIFSVLLLVSIIFSAWKFREVATSRNLMLDMKSQVMYVDIAGTINFTLANEVLETLGEADGNPFVRGIILRINSPGGTVGASQEIYNYLMKMKKSGKIIVAAMGDMAASGGYYIASAANLIVANKGSLTGSIGVVVSSLNFAGLMKNLGIKAITIKTGAMKDMLSPFREITAEEEKYMQNLIMNTYQQFINDIVAGRNGKVKEDKLKKIADGRIFTGELALKENLVDVLGSLETAKDEIKKLLNDNTIEFVMPKKDMFKNMLKDLLKTQSGDIFMDRLNIPVLYYYGGW